MVLAMSAMALVGCKGEFPTFEENPWDPQSDLEFVIIDSITYSQSLDAVFLRFHVDYSVLPSGNQLIWTRVHKNGHFRNQLPFNQGTNQIVDASVTSGDSIEYEIDFILYGGSITRKFGPFEFTVP